PGQLGYIVPAEPSHDPWRPYAAPSEEAPAPAAAPVRDTGAQEPAPVEKSAAFDLGVVTELPIMAGAQATLEVPYRFLFQGEIGVLPAAFVNAVDGALVGAGAYTANTSELVRGGLGNSLVVRLSGGWRPFADHGFEIMGGYTLTSLGGGLSAKA